MVATVEQACPLCGCTRWAFAIGELVGIVIWDCLGKVVSRSESADGRHYMVAYQETRPGQLPVKWFAEHELASLAQEPAGMHDTTDGATSHGTVGD